MLDFLNKNSTELTDIRDVVRASAAQAESFQAQSVHERFQKEQGIEEAEAQKLWRELVRYLIMVAKFPDRHYGMYGPVDALWHDFVLHTELYQGFCDIYARRFLHHHPCTTEKGSLWRSRYLQFLVDYQLIFGEAPPEKCWPLPEVQGLRLPESAGAVQPRHVRAAARIESGQRGIVGDYLALAGLELSTLLPETRKDAVTDGGWSGGFGGDGGGDGGGGCGGGCGGG